MHWTWCANAERWWFKPWEEQAKSSAGRLESLRASWIALIRSDGLLKKALSFHICIPHSAAIRLRSVRGSLASAHYMSVSHRLEACNALLALTLCLAAWCDCGHADGRSIFICVRCIEHDVGKVESQMREIALKSICENKWRGLYSWHDTLESKMWFTVLPSVYALRSSYWLFRFIFATEKVYIVPRVYWDFFQQWWGIRVTSPTVRRTTRFFKVAKLLVITVFRSEHDCVAYYSDRAQQGLLVFSCLDDSKKYRWHCRIINRQSG